ncbi:protein spire homolog 1-like [Discoglossus pictus]
MVTLEDILRQYGEPISEEQAWALCYQCCAKLRQLLWGGHQVPSLQGVGSIVLHQDGTVSFATSSGASNHLQSERKIIEKLGEVIYTALDWGVSSDLERTLSDPLDSLLHCMLGLQPGNIGFQDVLQTCAGRLLPPSKASSHYQAVCRVHFSEYKEFCMLLRNIERSKKSLMQMESESLAERESFVLYKSWGNLWSNVIKELRLGVRLRKAKVCMYQLLPINYTLTPYERLMNDIRHKRYTLREVKHREKSKLWEQAENFIMDFIRLQPLRPASERKLKERSLEEPSLHEMLMIEIKSVKKLRPTKSRRKLSFQDDDSGTPCSLRSIQCDDSIPMDYAMRSCRRRLQTIDQMDFECAANSESSRSSDYGSESSLDSKFSDLTSSISDMMFMPVLTSSQVDLKNSSFLHNDSLKFSVPRRTKSYESVFHKTMLGQTFYLITLLGWRQSAEQVICPDCCKEMLMPFKQCMLLPVSFFKTLVLTHEGDPSCQDQKAQQLYQEILHWDCSSVPLVFEPQELGENISLHKKNMKNWPSMDICVKCEEHIVEMVGFSNHSEQPTNKRKLQSRSASI